jgi:Ca-activated chloride channel family protein
MNFASWWAFLLLGPWLFAAWRLLRRAKRRGIVFSAVAFLPSSTGSFRARMARVLPFVFLAGALLLIIAAARPRSVLSREKKTVDAIAIAMVADISGSMAGLDMTGRESLRANRLKTRLDAVKEMFDAFVSRRPDDLIALITFGGFASTRSPLTADHQALRHVLKGVALHDQTADGEEMLTALGDGLATGLARLADAEPKTRIVILLSDGVSNAGVITPEQAAKSAKELGVRVYTIGVGSNGQTPFQVEDDYGRKHIQYYDTTFDESQLKTIADETGARYFGVKDSDGLEKALKEIDSLEKTRIERQVYNRYQEHFAPFLLWGAILTAIAVFANMHLLRRFL